MMKKKRVLLTACLLGTGLMLGGCGSEKLEKEATEVIELSITPKPTPTPEPVEDHPEAVAEKNGVTMINQYLMDKVNGR